MAVFDPYKRAKAIISQNAIGALAGAVGGIMLVRRFTPMRGWIGLTIGVVGGAVGGAFTQYKLKSFTGSKKSADAAKK